MMNRAWHFVFVCFLVGCAANLGEPGSDDTGSEPSDPSELSELAMTSTSTRPFLWGVGEPLVAKHNHGHPDPVQVDNELTGLIGVHPEVVRLWLDISAFAAWDGSQFSLNAAGSETKQAFDHVLDGLAKKNITVLGLGGINTTVETGELVDGELPCPSEAARYNAWLDRYEKAWAFLASQFPTVTYWEEGNEINYPHGLHMGERVPDANGRMTQYCDGTPITRDKTTGAITSVHTFDFNTTAAITVDMMFHASRGMKAGNAGAFAFSFALAAVDWTLPSPYDRDMSGLVAFIHAMTSAFRTNYPGVPGSKLFDGANWHPYFFDEGEPIQHFNTYSFWEANWVPANQAVYAAYQQLHGSDMPAVFSEVGFSDCFNPQPDAAGVKHCDDNAKDYWNISDNIARSERIAAHTAAANFPWLWGLVWFRMYDDPLATWGSPNEQKFGIVDDPGTGAPADPSSDDYVWKPAAHVFASLATQWPAIGVADGQVIKAPGSATIYLMHAGTKNWFPSLAVLQSYGFSPSDAVEVPASVVSTIPSGQQLSYREGTLVKDGNGTIYVVDQVGELPSATFELRRIKSFTAFTACGFQLGWVVNDAKALSTLTGGADLTTCTGAARPDGALISYNGTTAVVETSPSGAKQRRSIANTAAFASQRYSWSRVVAVSAGDWSALTAGPSVWYREGTVLNLNGDLSVIQQSGQAFYRHLVPDTCTFSAYGYDWSDPLSIPQTLVAKVSAAIPGPTALPAICP
jgi:hypothetical protein